MLVTLSGCVKKMQFFVDSGLCLASTLRSLRRLTSYGVSTPPLSLLMTLLRLFYRPLWLKIPTWMRSTKRASATSWRSWMPDFKRTLLDALSPQEPKTPRSQTSLWFHSFSHGSWTRTILTKSNSHGGQRKARALQHSGLTTQQSHRLLVST